MTTPTARLLADLSTAVDILSNGGVVALPTDTLYALAASARDADAVRRVYAIKGREGGKPLPLFVDGAAMASEIGVLDERAEALAARFWPGALTLVVKKQDNFASEALAGGDTVALRAPASDIALDALRRLAGPITGTSANRSGGPDPVTADDVRLALGDDVDFVLDAGACPGGVSSTIVDCTGAELRVLRAGAISEADLQSALAEGGA